MKSGKTLPDLVDRIEIRPLGGERLPVVVHDLDIALPCCFPHRPLNDELLWEGVGGGAVRQLRRVSVLGALR